jgi:hypothetical protein
MRPVRSASVWPTVAEDGSASNRLSMTSGGDVAIANSLKNMQPDRRRWPSPDSLGEYDKRALLHDETLCMATIKSADLKLITASGRTINLHSQSANRRGVSS